MGEMFAFEVWNRVTYFKPLTALLKFIAAGKNSRWSTLKKKKLLWLPNRPCDAYSSGVTNLRQRNSFDITLNCTLGEMFALEKRSHRDSSI